MAVEVTTTVHDEWPPFVIVAVTGLTVGDDVVLYRLVAGERTALRAGSVQNVVDASLVRADAEQPFGTPVRYVAVVNETDEYQSELLTVTLTGGVDGPKVAFSDAISGLSAEAIISAMPEKIFSRASSTFDVGGRTVAALGPMGGASYSLELLTETDTARRTLAALIRGATQGIIQIRCADPVTYEDVDDYVAVLAMTNRRFSQNGEDQTRLTTLECISVAPWVSDIESAYYTYADLEALFNGQDYSDLEGAYATYLELATADLRP